MKQEVPNFDGGMSLRKRWAIAGAVAVVGVGGMIWVLNNVSGDSGTGDRSVRSTPTPMATDVNAGADRVITIPPAFKDGTNYTDQTTGEWSAAAYKNRGLAFRSAIRLLVAREDPRAQDMIDLYRDLKTKSNGVEYDVNGDVFAPKLGDVLFIDDPTDDPSMYSGEKRGIFFRQNPTIEADPTTDITFLNDFNDVTIIDANSVRGVGSDGVEVEFWKVKVVFTAGSLQTDNMAKVGSIGWVRREWLEVYKK